MSNLATSKYVSDLFYKRAQWENKRFRHFRQVILNCFPLWQIILVVLLFGWGKKIIKEKSSTKTFLLSMMIIAATVNIILTYYHWKQLENCSRKIAKIDKSIAEELTNSNF